MESSIVGTKGQIVIPKKIRAMFHIKRCFEHMAGCLGTGGKALRVFLEEKKQERELYAVCRAPRFPARAQWLGNSLLRHANPFDR